MDRQTIEHYIQVTNNIELASDKFPELIDESNEGYHFGCVLHLDEQLVAIELRIGKKFPKDLPKFYLSKYDQLGFLPHVDPPGTVCYLETESAYVNIEEPEIVFQASVQRVIQTLSDGLKGENVDDFREEFTSYWNSNELISKYRVCSVIEVNNKARRVHVVKTADRVLVYEQGQSIVREKAIFKIDRNPKTRCGIYIPLKEKGKLIPPRFDERWTVNQFTEWLKPLVDKSIWDEVTGSLLKNKPSRVEYVLLGIPRKTGEPLLVGVHLISQGKSTHPFLEPDSSWVIALHKVNRFDAVSYLPRGGAEPTLQNEKVLLIGCGSVGSHIAIELAKSGLGYLHLVDNDVIQGENIQRFAIGLQWLSTGKVFALKSYLESNYLNIEVNAHPMTFGEYQSTVGYDLSSFDLVISATGDPTVNFYINSEAKKYKVPFVVGWNEPFGIGGHALLSLPNEPGCYRCLFDDLYNRASFAAMDQQRVFHKKHLGCGGVFTPYSAMDSVKTSELVTRLSTRFLDGNEQKSQILSWKGDSTAFENEGFILSSRYSDQTKDDLDRYRFDFVNENCPHCGKKDDSEK